MPDNGDPKRPSFEERLEAINHTLELVAAMHIDDDREFRERIAQLDKRIAEIARRQEQDGEHIHALVRIAEIHEQRLSRLEGDEPQ